MTGSLKSRDRRALMLLAGGVVLFALLQSDFLLPTGRGGPDSSGSIEAAEERFLLAQVKARQKPLVDAEFAAAGKMEAAMAVRLLRSENSALAQAEMREIVGDLLRAERINMTSSQFGAVRLEGEDFAQVPLAVTFTCGIERFVNLMAAVANSAQLLSTRQIKIVPEGGEGKRIRVELTVAGYLPASRTPELVKKASAAGAKL